jgi:putative PIN family toxin of toxin-antitoxin system
MQPFQIVLDTSVFIAGLRSNRGASFRLLSLIGHSNRFEINLSVPLVLEYEDVVKRPGIVPALSSQDVGDILDYLCLAANLHNIFFLWRPFLRDPKDDMVLELAVHAQCDYIVTFNLKDFVGIEQFGIQPVTPQQFLRMIGELS